MTVNVGVIGVGMIGQDHIRRLTKVLAGSAVVAVTDVDAGRPKAVAAACRRKAFATGQELIGDKAVDAVVVASWGADARGVRAGLHRRRQAGVLREAAGDLAGGLPAHPRGRDEVRPAPGPGRLHAPLRCGLPRAEGDARQRRASAHR